MWNLRKTQLTKLLEKEVRLTVTRGRGWARWANEGDPKVQISSYKINMYEGYNVQYDDNN